MADDARIEDLRGRLTRDPSSIAFAQLAEELRRIGRQAEAVVVSRTGLAIYPEDLSARVTLGRALLELNRLDEAQQELELVRRSAPDNIAAIRALADIHERLTRIPERAPAISAEPTPASASLAPSTPEPPPPPPTPLPTPAAPAPAAASASRRVSTVDEVEYLRIVRTVGALESWLTAIHVTRAERRA